MARSGGGRSGGGARRSSAVAQVEASAQEEVQAGAFHLRVRGAGVQAVPVAVQVVLVPVAEAV